MDTRERKLAISIPPTKKFSSEERIGINNGDNPDEFLTEESDPSCCNQCTITTVTCGLSCVFSCVLAFLSCQDACERQKYEPVK